MIKNYLKIALRNIQKDKLFSFVNVFGLSIGLTIFFLFSSLFIFHLSFDQNHEDSELIHLITAERTIDNGDIQIDAYTYLPLAHLMKEHLHGVKEATVFRKYFKEIYKYRNKTMYEDQVLHVGPDFLSVFNFPIIMGDKYTPLSTTNSVILTQSTARKYFGDGDPIGKIITAERGQRELMVTAITRDCPANSSFKFDILVSLPDSHIEDWNRWGSTYTFVKIDKATSPKQLERKLTELVENYAPPIKESETRLHTFPLKDLHLRSDHIQSGFYNQPIFQYYWLLGIALALLIIVATNLVILSTSKYSYRAKEVGVRKVVGARRKHLIQQYLIEATMLSVLTFPVSVLLFDLISPTFSSVIGVDVAMPFWERPELLLGAFFLTILVGFLSGIYPAFFLSSFQPLSIMKGKISHPPEALDFRKAMVVFQFVLSFTMILFTLVSMKQIKLVSNVDLGYERENLITIEVNNDLYKRVDIIENELMSHPTISMVATGHELPFSWGRQEKIRPKGYDIRSSENINSYPCGYNFIEALEMRVIAGRSFSKSFNDENSIVISESTADYYGWDEPLGKTIILDDRGGKEMKVIGVLENFHFPHVFYKQAPSVIYLLPEEPFYLYIKTAVTPNKEIISAIKETWEKFVPELPFEYYTVQDGFLADLRTTLKSFELIRYTAIVSVLIACLGLYAQCSFSVERRTKEIGIRKALGAPVKRILKLLISNFMKLIAISILLALPLGYYFSSYLINMGWVYRIKLGIEVFIFATMVLVLSALVAVGVRSYLAAKANPVESLKHE